MQLSFGEPSHPSSNRHGIAACLLAFNSYYLSGSSSVKAVGEGQSGECGQAVVSWPMSSRWAGAVRVESRRGAACGVRFAVSRDGDGRVWAGAKASEMR